MNHSDSIFFDAGIFIGALLGGDGRYHEARPLVEAARNENLSVCTSTGILSEVYATLTWINAQPPHSPTEAANAVRLLVESPSEIKILPDNLYITFIMLELAEKHRLTARRRHAAIALKAGITKVFTYDINDWKVFEPDGLLISGPPSIRSNLS